MDMQLYTWKIRRSGKKNTRIKELSRLLSI